MHALRYVLAALRSPIEKAVGTFRVSYTGESGSHLVSCIMMLAEEKEAFQSPVVGVEKLVAPRGAQL
jgi:hypothetical protein